MLVTTVQCTCANQWFYINIKQIYSSEKIRNSGRCIYDYGYAHSLFREDFVGHWSRDISLTWIMYIFVSINAYLCEIYRFSSQLN